MGVWVGKIKGKGRKCRDKGDRERRGEVRGRRDKLEKKEIER